MYVLIADSSKLFQDIVAKIFTAEDVFHAVVETGDDALFQLGIAQFDLICIALHLSDMNGIELTRLIRELPDYAFKPIVLLTAEDSDDIQEKALANGVTRVFHKQDIAQLAQFANYIL